MANNQLKNTVVGADTDVATELSINGAASDVRQLGIYTAGTIRWKLLASGGDEAGANAGSTLKLVAYDDSGVLIDYPLTVTRASAGTATIARPVSLSSTLAVTGATTLSGALSQNATPLTVGANATSSTRINLNGAAATTRSLQFQTAGVNRWAFAEGNDAESGSDAGSKFNIAAYKDDGTFIDSPMSIVRASGGAMTLSRPITAQSTLGVTGATTLSSTLGVTGATSLSSTLGVTGATTLSSTLAVTGTSTLTGAVTLGAARYDKAVTLTDAATIAVDASLGNVFDVTLTASGHTMGAPTNPVNGQRIALRIRQDGTGSRTMSWNAIYRFSTTRPSPTLTTTAAKTDIVEFIYNSQDTKWDVVNIDLGH